ncbi:carbonic anhydrase [Nitrosomonas cryotolerans]|uniref:carbonic anhydrase n=1 Tax=Nitrosomonas cryotolerans ATCC 49181 TaxID=1131553 RepID=A0A1N6HX11_9PROT|nr:carbonic anhydrase [Nitrosomonas cryotolerans]SFP69369.1 carbonic anhydrase [Nitrosomonas cryotolerans]SIO24364.1 carbonic anhydrase [Nitrosomonas cryotolerans ATCC 49181]
MCDTDDPTRKHQQPIRQRRSFLKLAATSTFGLGATVTVEKLIAASGAIKTPALPENILTPDAALERLMAGNKRYIAGQSTPMDFNLQSASLIKGQNPYACILSCSDSRVSPEFCFDEQLGDLFVARVAGNYLTTDFVATLEYAAAILHTPLIMVLGHESCGAIKAAINASDNNEQFPGHIQTMSSALAPAVRAAERISMFMSGDRYYNVVKMNVILNARELKKQTPILSKLVTEKRLLVVGGIYSLETGIVELVA